MSRSRSALARAPKHGSLSKYDPEKELKSIAVLDGIEKYLAKAKDVGKLQLAIRDKLERQAEFVLWWDTKGPGTNVGGRGKKPVSDLKQVLPSRLVVHRWRSKLNDPKKFEATHEAATSAR